MDLVSLKKLNLFFRQFKKLRYKRREIILRADDNPLGVFYLQKGYSREYAASEEGQELTLIIYQEGDFFPLRWAINRTSNNHFIEAMTAVELYRAPREKFMVFIQKNPEVLMALMSRIVVRWGGFSDRVEHLVLGNAYSKVASILFICAERFGVAEGKGMAIQVPLAHKDIASLIGIARETASLEIEKLEKLGIITYRQHFFVVKDMNKLQKEALLYDS